MRLGIESTATPAWLLMLLVGCMLATVAKSQGIKKQALKTGLVLLKFNHVVMGGPLVLDDSNYIHPSGEQYTVHKFKYYISNLRFYSKGKETFLRNQYFLIDHSNDSSCTLKLRLPENEYDSLELMIGVDSTLNVAGAQTGVLDPLSDMYWTWQSGYIMQKLEGSSPQSNAVNNKMEYHLGGYSGPNSTQRLISLSFSKPLKIQNGHKSNIIVKAELNKFWLGITKLSIKETPVCSSMGTLARVLSFNFAGMFSLESVTNN